MLRRVRITNGISRIRLGGYPFLPFIVGVVVAPAPIGVYVRSRSDVAANARVAAIAQEIVGSD